MSDSDEITALLGKYTLSQYTSEQWLYMSDQTGNGNYGAGQVQYDTEKWTDKLMDWPKAYLSLPLSCDGIGKTTGVGNDFPSQSGIALKNGLYQLIWSFIMQINGRSVQNASYLQLINHIRNMIEASVDWELSHGAIANFFKDDVDSTDVSPMIYQVAGSTANTSGGASAAAVTVLNNPNYNSGFYNRIKFTNASYSSTPSAAGTSALCSLKFYANIDLKFISDFFRQLNQPLQGCRFNFTFGFTGTPACGGANLFNPIMVNTGTATTLGSNTVTLTIGGSLGSNNGSSGFTGTRLYCPQVTLNPTDAIRYAELINQGFSSTTVWDDTYTVKNTSIQPQTAAQTTGTQIQFKLSSGIRAPQKVWTVLLPVTDTGGALSSNMGSQISASPCVTSKAGLSSFNLLVDTVKLHNYDVNLPFEQYQLLAKEFYQSSKDMQSGSLISYADFKDGNHKYFVFDVSRVANYDTNKMIGLDIVGIKTDNVACEIYHIIEFRCQTTISYLNGAVIVTHLGANS